MGNDASSIYNFEWLNGGRVCQGTVKKKDTNIMVTCTDQNAIKWGNDLQKICLHYNDKRIVVINRKSHIIAVTPTAIHIVLPSAGHKNLCYISLFTDKCVGKIVIKNCY